MRYIATALGLAMFTGSVFANPEIPDYKNAELLREYSFTIAQEGETTKVGKRSQYKSGSNKDLEFDITVSSMICSKKGINIEYPLIIRDFVNQRLFVLDIFGGLEKIVEGKENIEKLDEKFPECPGIQSA